LRRTLVVLSLGLCVLFLLALVLSQIEQHLLRRRAKALLSVMQSLELRKTSWQEARARLQPWKSNTKFDQNCDQLRCSLTITLDDLVYSYFRGRYRLEWLDDYLRWKLNLTYQEGPFAHFEETSLRCYMHLGGHPAHIEAGISIRDGFVWRKSFWVSIETHANRDQAVFGGASVYYALIAETRAVSRFTSGDEPLPLHPDYSIGRPGGCEICVMGWAKFTPYAEPRDVQRLMQLDLSCLTRWRPCLTQSDIMPAAWAQYVAERPRVENARRSPECSGLVIQTLGRDSAKIAVGEVLALHKTASDDADREGVARVRIIERLKGSADWKIGDIRDVHFSPWPGEANSGPRVGQKLIFFAYWDHFEELRIEPSDGCPIMLANESNLALVRSGMAEDFSSSDNAN